MKVKVYDHLDEPYPTISFYTKRGKVVFNFAKRCIVVCEKVYEQPHGAFTWRVILEKKFK